jgi:hypothetical protein
MAPRFLGNLCTPAIVYICTHTFMRSPCSVSRLEVVNTPTSFSGAGFILDIFTFFPIPARLGLINFDRPWKRPSSPSWVQHSYLLHHSSLHINLLTKMSITNPSRQPITIVNSKETPLSHTEQIITTNKIWLGNWSRFFLFFYQPSFSFNY